MPEGRTSVPRPPSAGPLIDENGFCAWVAQAEAGEVLVYHRGFLVIDGDELLSTLAPEVRAELRRLADAAFRAAGQGLVHLVQARLGMNRFAYIAIARPKDRPAGAALSMRLLEAA